jgi:hypothetical protein
MHHRNSWNSFARVTALTIAAALTLSSSRLRILQAKVARVDR